MGNSDSAHSRPLPIQEDADEDGMGNGQKMAKGLLPIQDALPTPKSTDFEGNGQMGKGRIREDKNEGEQLDYEYTETE